jgi:hypothetical protein
MLVAQQAARGVRDMIDPDVNADVTLLANVALALSLVVALIFGIAQVRAAARDRRERLTLETLRAFQTAEFAASIHRISSGLVPRTNAELKALPADDQIVFIQFAQQMESVGLSVAERLISLDLVEKTLGSFVKTAWDAYHPVFQDMRDNIPDPYVGEYFQWLAELLDRRMRQKPRRPAYRAAG